MTSQLDLIIEIIYDETQSIMEIKRNGKSIFYDYFWKFDPSPKGMKQFLERLKLNVKLSEKVTIT